MLHPRLHKPEPKDADLQHKWRVRFRSLPPEARIALRLALFDLRRDAQARANYQWRKHNPAKALWWKVIAVYAGHIARVLRYDEQETLQGLDP